MLDKTSPETKRQQRLWTTNELSRAGQLWREGRTIREVAHEIGRSYESLKHQIETRRDVFPRRRTPRSDVGREGRPVTIKLTISPFLHKLVKKEARARRISMNMVLREAIRDTLLRRVRKEIP